VRVRTTLSEHLAESLILGGGRSKNTGVCCSSVHGFLLAEPGSFDFLNKKEMYFIKHTLMCLWMTWDRESISVFLSCYDKILQINNRNLFLIVLETESLSSKCKKGLYWVRPLSLSYREPPSYVSINGFSLVHEGGKRERQREKERERERERETP
jgi:hypothetical protein